MTWRFRRTVRILPGVRLNLAKTGPSLSLGHPGYTVNLRRRRIRQTVSLPGTGLSASTSSHVKGAGARLELAAWLLFLVAFVVAIGWLLSGVE